MANRMSCNIALNATIMRVRTFYIYILHTGIRAK